MLTNNSNHFFSFGVCVCVGGGGSGAGEGGGEGEMGQRAGTGHRDFGTLTENHSLSINILIGHKGIVCGAGKQKQTAEIKHA